MNRTVIPEFVVKSVVKTAIKNKDFDVLLSLCEKGYTKEVREALK